MKWQISHGVGGGKENFWIYLLTSDKWAVFNCLLDWCMSSRFWRGGHCSCGGRVLLSCIQICMCLILHACLWKEPIAFTFSSLFQLCVCAHACLRATVCVPLKSCSCKRTGCWDFPKPLSPWGSEIPPTAPLCVGLCLSSILSVCRNAPTLVISDIWRGGQGRASRWNLQGLSVGKERWAARKTLEVGLFIFLAGHGSQTEIEVDT